MPLTKTDLAAVYRACELLENEEERFSCFALSKAMNWVAEPLIRNYCDFFNQSKFLIWEWSEDYETRKIERIMALLFFAAAGGEL